MPQAEIDGTDDVHGSVGKWEIFVSKRHLHISLCKVLARSAVAHSTRPKDENDATQEARCLGGQGEHHQCLRLTLLWIPIDMSAVPTVDAFGGPGSQGCSGRVRTSSGGGVAQQGGGQDTSKPGTNGTIPGCLGLGQRTRRGACIHTYIHRYIGSDSTYRHNRANVDMRFVRIETVGV